VLERKHWDLLTTKLTQPIAAYEKLASAGVEKNAAINWPPDLIHHYQEKFIDGYALSSAWQEVPVSLVVGVCEEVRNRLLRFALEIKEELGHVGDNSSAVLEQKVEAAVINHIYGGVNVIGGTVKDFAQIGNVMVGKGDIGSLANALKRLDVSQSEIDALKEAINVDEKSFGERTKEWLLNIGSKLGSAGLKVGTDASTELIKGWLHQYFS
jgi:hypothetical protein